MDLNCHHSTNRVQANDKFLFIKNLSLEIINTLNGLEGFLSLINKTALDERNKELLNQAKYATFILSNQIKSLDYLYETNQKCPQVNFMRFNLQEIMVNVFSFYRENLEEKNLYIDFNCDENIPSCLYGDSLKLNEIISSLIENVFLLAKSNVSIVVKLLNDKIKSKVIHFELFLDGGVDNLITLLNNEKISLSEKIFYKENIKKIDVNFAISKEFVSQLGGQFICNYDENGCITISFDIEFYADYNEKL